MWCFEPAHCLGVTGPIRQAPYPPTRGLTFGSDVNTNGKLLRRGGKVISTLPGTTSADASDHAWASLSPATDAVNPRVTPDVQPFDEESSGLKEKRLPVGSLFSV